MFCFNFKKYFFSLVLSCLSLQIFSEDINKVQNIKEWTVLSYMAANNDLCFPFANLNLTQASAIGSNANVNLLAFVNEYCQVLDEYNNDVGSSRFNRTCKIVINKDSFSREVLSVARDSGSEKTLMEAIDWAMTNYPSKKFALILWDHGSGSLNRDISESLTQRAICFDFVTRNFLTDRKVQLALDYACNKYKNGQKIDVVACDACLMSCVEFAHAVSPYANYLLSAQETIPGAGYNYTTFYAPFKNGNPTPQELIINGVSAFANNYSTNRFYSFTLSALNLNKLSSLSNNINYLSSILITLLQSNYKRSVAQAIKYAALNSHYFSETYYLDVKDFYVNLSKSLNSIDLDSVSRNNLNNAFAEGIRLINGVDENQKLVLANAFSKDHALASGISIYFPVHKAYSGYSFRVDSTYNTLQFALVNKYAEFINLWSKCV